METRYTITELSKELGVHIQTLRKYEQDFALLIPRDEHKARYYTDTEKGLFENILRMKKEGLAAKAIRTLLGHSVDAIEQRGQAVALATVDRLTGDDVSLLIKAAVKEAMVEAIREVMPEILAELRKQEPVPEPVPQNKKPSIWERLRGK